jgi:hypothetical protein
MAHAWILGRGRAFSRAGGNTMRLLIAFAFVLLPNWAHPQSALSKRRSRDYDGRKW